MARCVEVVIPFGGFSLFSKRATKTIQVKADEIHISTHGVLVLKRYGNIIETYASGEWLTAKLIN